MPKPANRLAAAVPVAATARSMALRHHPLLAGALAHTDSKSDFEAFAAALIADLDPIGALETTLAARAATLAWRLARAQAVESAFLSKPDHFGAQLSPLENALDNPRDVTMLEGLGRWETNLQRAFLRTLDALEAQKARRGEEETRPLSPDCPPERPK